MKRLVKEGLVTTILGISIIIFAGAMIWTGKSDVMSTSGWVSLGLAFLRSKDSLIGITNKEK
jgi:type IV secretory pathway VirB2 component (pilin)